MKEKYIEESITKEDKRDIRKQRIVNNKLRTHQWDEAKKSVIEEGYWIYKGATVDLPAEAK